MRSQTPNDLVYVELNVPSVKPLIQRRQLDFLKKYKQQSFYDESPLKHAIDMAQRSKKSYGIVHQRT